MNVFTKKPISVSFETAGFNSNFIVKNKRGEVLASIAPTGSVSDVIDRNPRLNEVLERSNSVWISWYWTSSERRQEKKIQQVQKEILSLLDGNDVIRRGNGFAFGGQVKQIFPCTDLESNRLAAVLRLCPEKDCGNEPWVQSRMPNINAAIRATNSNRICIIEEPSRWYCSFSRPHNRLDRVAIDVSPDNSLNSTRCY